MQVALFVLIAATITFTRTITSSTMRNWDEAWYAEIIKNMASGNYGIMQPFWNGRYYFDHAPLYFWLSTPIFKIFGPGLWQTRAVSATAAILACLFIFLIAKKLAGTIAGLASVLIFLTLGGVTIRFAHGNLDSLLICFFLASFYCYLKSEKQKLYAVAIGTLIGLGFLIKSWGIGLFPLFLIFIYSFVKNRKLPNNLLIILTTIIIFSAWWYILGFLTFGKQFLDWYIFNPSEDRLTTPFVNFSLDYFRFAIRDIGLWLVPPIIYIFLKFKDLKKLDKNIILPFSSLSIIYIFSLNFLSDKSAWYLIPSLAQIAIVVGYFFQKLYLVYPKFGITLFGLIFFAQIININRIENIYPDRSYIGVELGKQAEKIIPKGSTVILNDQDFTSFLFYSNQTAIYTLENKQTKTNEWWIISPQSLPNFLASHKNIWIITPSPQSLPIKISDNQIKYQNNGYSFINY